MLERLSIRNFAIIEQMDITFKNGITVITGETGAGKSILIDALSILLGERANIEFIRHEKDCFLIEGVFAISNNKPLLKLLSQKNILVEDELLYISRSYSLKKKSLILVNGQAVPLKTLREIGTYLADIHGQYSNQSLLNNSIHHEFLDYYNDEGKDTYTAYSSAYKQYRVAKKRLETLEEAARDRAREIDMLNYQINEITDANINIDEDNQLNDEIQRFDNYERLYTTTSSAYEAINRGRYPLLDILNTLKSEITDIVEYDATLKNIEEMISSAYFNIEEASHSLYNYIDMVSYDEDRHNYCKQRDSLLYSLKVKYGPELLDVVNYLKTAQDKLFELENANIEREEVEIEYNKAKAEAFNLKAKLNKIRKVNKENITQKVESILSNLGMEKASLSFEIIETDELNSLGANSIELLFAPNKGEGYKPLAKIASGGELSRIALAFSTVIKRFNQVVTVFDEIDVGISGDVALKVAETLQSLAEKEQILCITHMPQTVAIATHHYTLGKEEINKRTISTIKNLSFKEHVEYMATMISGSKLSETTLATANELIGKFKAQGDYYA